VPDADAELLESLLAKVMRLLAMHGDAPVGDLAGTALSVAEGVLLVELLATGEVTQQQVADRLRLDKSRVSRLCSALERKHLLARQRDERNRRNLRVPDHRIQGGCRHPAAADLARAARAAARRDDPGRAARPPSRPRRARERARRVPSGLRDGRGVARHLSTIQPLQLSSSAANRLKRAAAL